MNSWAMVNDMVGELVKGLEGEKLDYQRPGMSVKKASGWIYGSGQEA